MSKVPSNPKEEEVHLAEQHGLVKAIVFVRKNDDKKRSAGAERVARHRQQKRDNGLVQVDVPVAIAEKIREEGSFNIWYEKRFTPLPEEKIRRIKWALKFAKKFEKLPRWLRRIFEIDF